VLGHAQEGSGGRACDERSRRDETEEKRLKQTPISSRCALVFKGTIAA
jgi:hypothetical protein